MPEPKIPSIVTILESTGVLSSPYSSKTIVRVEGDFAVKYGTSVTLLEAQNLSFIAKHSNVPVPEVYGTLTEESTGRNFIIMEVIPGETLSQVWPNLTSSEKEVVVDQFRDAMKELRSIPAPGYIGSVDRQACGDGIFWTTNRYDPRASSISGPFDGEDDMNKGILQQLAVVEQENILVQRTDGVAGEKEKIQIKIIDWESAGWYPEYWDYANTTATSKRLLSSHPEWLDIVQSTMKLYPYEEVTMDLVRKCFRY